MTGTIKKIVDENSYENKISKNIECWKKTLNKFKDFPKKQSEVLENLGEYSKTNFITPECVKEDCIEIAINLVKEGYNPLLLNMADWQVAGGLVDAGVQTQEEDLFRRSNYHTLLHQIYYPMTTYRTIVSKGVEFWLNKDFNELAEPIHIDCVASPSLCGYNAASGQKKEIMKKKIQMLLYAAHINGNDSIVLSAWGCGAYRCDAHDMAELFKEVIDEGVPVKKIVFAVLGKNYELFKQSLLH